MNPKSEKQPTAYVRIWAEKAERCAFCDHPNGERVWKAEYRDETTSASYCTFECAVKAEAFGL